MGNSESKQSRQEQRGQRPGQAPEASQAASQPSDRYERARNRVSRADLGGNLGGFLGIAGHASGSQPPYERKETRQEREARRLERERQMRLIERERSMKEEHVDGGYLVTLGTYVGPEDFSKPMVRQLQVRFILTLLPHYLQVEMNSWDFGLKY
jgi:hypothetical protein